MNEKVVYVNGEFYPEDKAKISVFDRGFLYGDGAYDSFVVINGKGFKIDEHVDRLYRSISALRIRSPMTKEEMKKALLETCRRNNVKNAYLRVIVSRGIGKYPLLDPRVAKEPTLVIFVSDMELPDEIRKTYTPKEGLSVITSSMRKIPPICLDSRIKSLNYLNSVLARGEAVALGADEAIMLDINNFVAEGTGDNVFLIKGNVLYTPPVVNILDGITRRTIINLATSEGYQVEERNLTLYDLYTADEAFLTSTVGGVIPVIEVNGKKIGDGRAGSITLSLKKSYNRIV